MIAKTQKTKRDAPRVVSRLMSATRSRSPGNDDDDADAGGSPLATTAPRAARVPITNTLGEPIENVWSEIMQKTVPNYAHADIPPDIIAAAGLKNGMSADAVNAAVHKVVTARETDES